MQLQREQLKGFRKKMIGLLAFCELTGMNNMTVQRIENMKVYNLKSLRLYLYHLSSLFGEDIEVVIKKGQPNE